MKPAPFDYFAPTTVDDVLCYSTKPLERPTEVTDPIELVLFAPSSARDTDFTAKRVNVYPHGRAASITTVRTPRI
ncbi:MAG TPA: CocE/NonD family hydrolase C-terminal non-catalytic domain-containing protein [Ktedonobacteraceae bacterium]|nr:CocE/NonD family hydrolase C-terminal non-catalytic domain-containing protein [Ktedonobacteraceae bacterium]